jgi:hypothetical protein
MMNSILWKCLGECQDYFAQLGGSGRYESYREWHSPCLVLMMFLESHHSEEFIQRKKIELDLPEQLWERTDGLPLKIKSLLKDEPVTREMLTEFIEQVKEKMKIQVREHFGWVSFTNAIKLDLAEITRI